MKALIKLLPLSLLLFLFSNCTPTRVSTTASGMYDNDDIDMLYANSWNLAEIHGMPVAKSGDHYAYLSFTPGAVNRISGSTGCNTINGSFTYSGTSGLTFTPSISTKNTCVNSKTEADILHSLRSTDSWGISNNQLVLYRNGEVLARLNKATDYYNTKLNGNWQLSYINDTSMPFEKLYTTKVPSITFADGKTYITGTSSCNSLNCPVVINGNGISFGDCTGTKMACDGTGEKIFMTSLGTVNGYKLTDDNTLILVTDDNTVMRFRRI